MEDDEDRGGADRWRLPCWCGARNGPLKRLKGTSCTTGPSLFLSRRRSTGDGSADAEERCQAWARAARAACSRSEFDGTYHTHYATVVFTLSSSTLEVSAKKSRRVMADDALLDLE